MAQGVENLKDVDLGRDKSTTPAFFNAQESLDSTLPRFQYPSFTVQAAVGLPIPEPEAIRMIYVSDSASTSFLGKHLSAPASQYPVVDWVSTVMLDQGTYLTGKSLNAEVDCLLKVNSGQIYIIECKTYPSQVATTRRAVLLAAASAHGFSRIEAALDQVRIAVGQDKVRAQFEATHTITRAGASVEDVDRAIRLLLGVHRSGRLDDAIDILALLGRDVVHAVAQARLSVFAPDGSNDDYWYVLIRAAGRTGDHDLLRRFLGSRFIALEEAAVQALGDIGDSTALKDLRRIANDPRRSQLIRELAEELASEIT